jgi:hypothetical protein
MKKIRSGKKTATTRMGLKNYQVGPVVFVNSKDSEDRIEGFNIWSIVATHFDQLNFPLWEQEGYTGHVPFINALERIYGKIEREQIMTVVYFSKRKMGYLEYLH